MKVKQPHANHKRGLLPFKAKPLPKNAKSALPVDKHRSNLLVCSSKSIFKPRTSTESRFFSILDSGQAQIFLQVVSITVKTRSNTDLVASRNFIGKLPPFPPPSGIIDLVPGSWLLAPGSWLLAPEIANWKYDGDYNEVIKKSSSNGYYNLEQGSEFSVHKYPLLLFCFRPPNISKGSRKVFFFAFGHG